MFQDQPSSMNSLYTNIGLFESTVNPLERFSTSNCTSIRDSFHNTNTAVNSGSDSGSFSASYLTSSATNNPVCNQETLTTSNSTEELLDSVQVATIY